MTGVPSRLAQYVDALVAGDTEAAYAAVSGALADGLSLVDVQAAVIRAGQEQIGVLWQGNRISVVQEHLATGISEVVLARLGSAARPSARHGRSIVVACVEGEHHDLPARLVADWLALDGFDVRHLGADVPTDALIPALTAWTPHLLALSVTMTFHVRTLRDTVARVREAAPNLPILVGGHAIDWSPGIPAELGVETAPREPAELLAAVRRLTGVAP